MITKYAIYLLVSLLVIVTLGTSEAGVRLTDDPRTLEETQRELKELRTKDDTIVNKISEKMMQFELKKH